MTILSRFLATTKAFLFPSIDHVISDLTNKVEHLRDLAVSHEQHAVERAKAAAEHLATSTFHNSEADRARRVAQKIEKLVA
jgi:hypothetical protein